MSTPWQALVTHRCVFVVETDMGGGGVVHWVDGQRTATEAEVQVKRTGHTLAGDLLRPLIHPSGHPNSCRLLLLASSKPQIRFGLAATHIQAQWQQVGWFEG